MAKKFNTTGVLGMGALGLLGGAVIGACTGGIGLALLGTAFGIPGAVAGGIAGGTGLTTLSTLFEACDPSGDDEDAS